MTDEELIARLGEIQGQAGLFASAAAARIEQLVATNEALLAERKKDHANINLKADFIDKTINQLAEADAKLAKAVALLIEASADLTEYVDADYPPESRARYPDIARRHHRDLELVRRIDATLAAVSETHKIKGESHDPL